MRRTLRNPTFKRRTEEGKATKETRKAGCRGEESGTMLGCISPGGGEVLHCLFKDRQIGSQGSCHSSGARQTWCDVVPATHNTCVGPLN